MAFDKGSSSYNLMAGKKYDSFQPQDMGQCFNSKIRRISLLFFNFKRLEYRAISPLPL